MKGELLHLKTLLSHNTILINSQHFQILLFVSGLIQKHGEFSWHWPCLKYRTSDFFFGILSSHHY
jgi:hypothetical protein